MVSGTGDSLVAESLLVVVVAFVVALSAASATCYSAEACALDGTCVVREGSRRGWWVSGCSFSNRVPLAAVTVYSNTTRGALQSSTQAYCAAGERLALVAGQRRCFPSYNYPNAIQTDIMDGQGLTPSAAACGAWMGSGASSHVEYFRSYKANVQRDAILSATTFSMGLGQLQGRSNVGKLVGACHRAFLGGSAALRAMDKLAYDEIARGIGPIHSTDDAIVAAGHVASHYCSGAASIGWVVRESRQATDPQALAAFVDDGVAFGPGALGDALGLVDAPHTLAEAAERANAAIANDAGAPPATSADFRRLLSSSTGVSAYLDPATTIETAKATPVFNALLSLAQRSPGDAQAYLHGTAAMCAFSLRGASGVATGTVFGAAGADTTRRARTHPRLASLGRLARDEMARAGDYDEPPIFHDVDNRVLRDATTATLAQLVGVDTDDAMSKCDAFARMLFPDDFDAAEFELVVSSRLYTRLQNVTAEMRTHVHAVFANNAAIRNVMGTSDANAVAGYVQGARLRIPGAPRGSWAGAAREIPHARFDSSDGLFVMAAKQARTLWLDRMAHLVPTATNICDGPPIVDSLASNAMIWWSGSSSCTWFHLGLLARPIADEAYDDESLMARVGGIVAHEFGHLSMNDVDIRTARRTTTQPDLMALLRHYPSYTYTEAIADVISGLALVNYGLNSSRVCTHTAQMWCARVPVAYTTMEPFDDSSVHPPANLRGDALCRTLSDLV